MSEHSVGEHVFIDHMSGFLQGEYQLGFSPAEIIRATHAYEKHCLDHIIMVDTYLANHGVFKANEFINRIREHAQRLCFVELIATTKMWILKWRLTRFQTYPEP